VSISQARDITCGRDELHLPSPQVHATHPSSTPTHLYITARSLVGDFPTSSSQRGLHGSASTHAVHRRCLRCRSRYSKCASTQCSRRVVCGGLLVCWLGESNCARRGVRAKTRDVLRLRSWADHYHFCYENQTPQPHRPPHPLALLLTGLPLRSSRPPLATAPPPRRWERSSARTLFVCRPVIPPGDGSAEVAPHLFSERCTPWHHLRAWRGCTTLRRRHEGFQRFDCGAIAPPPRASSLPSPLLLKLCIHRCLEPPPHSQKHLPRGASSRIVPAAATSC
jgi:hypothetical protein